MPIRCIRHSGRPHSIVRRLCACTLTIVAGTLLSAALLWLAGQPVGAVQAAPLASTLVVPGACGSTIQACIDAAASGDTLIIQAGIYTESLTLAKPVSLTGVSQAAVVLRALPNQRVLIVTGASVNSAVLISELTLSGGNRPGNDCPFACGAGMLVTATAQPKW